VEVEGGAVEVGVEPQELEPEEGAVVEQQVLEPEEEEAVELPELDSEPVVAVEGYIPLY